jgi:polyisoprenyl-teichoic acid--peptidoglycan teichoic acid transferase
MYSRKFYFTLSNIILVFLFVAGLLILGYISKGNPPGNILPGGFIDGLLSKKEPVNILVLGGDKVSGNTDSMMVVNYNPTTAKISVLSIPRDTKVKIDGNTHKINFAYPHGGIKLAMKTISGLLDVNINYYIYIDTPVFREIIDELGGVDADVPPGMDYDDPAQNLHIHLSEGRQHLNGKEAEGFMRFRHPNSWKKSGKEIKQYYDGSDIKRIDAQQKLIKELVKQKVNILYLHKYNKIINMIFNKVETNVTLEEALKLSNNITSIKVDEVTTFKLMGDDKRINGGWYYLYNGKIFNNNTKEEYDADVVLDEYFKADDGFSEYKNESDKSTESDESDTKNTTSKSNTSKKSTKKNPSNKETSIKGTKKPAP